MRNARLLAIGDDVCDKYLSRGKMYPGGQAVNTCAYAVMNGVEAAFLGKFGSDEVAQCLQETLDALGLDRSRCRSFEGENGFACVTLAGSDRVFIGSNKGGVAAVNPYCFTAEDLDYIKGFDLVYSDLNAYVEEDLPFIASAGVPIAYDFSLRWTDAYLARICPYIKVALLSCAHLDQEAREREMKKAASYGVPLVLGTIGEDGSWLLYRDRFYYAPAVLSDDVFDTMGAGDSYFATFLSTLLKKQAAGEIHLDGSEDLSEALVEAMNAGAAFAAGVCGMEGAFGYGVPIAGRIIDNRNQSV
ncbi:MAG: fructoselysine 6-kinase [Oscillospiraceae bacterium]|nr:fructoselysine 6-kinase [Oscillospiraceae bacterium]